MKKLDFNKVGFVITFIITSGILIHKIINEGFLFFIINY